MTWIEKLILAAVVAFLVVSCIGFARQAEEFEQHCRDAGGTAVHNGRNYECIQRQR